MRVELYGEKSLEENTGRIELYLARVTWTASGQVTKCKKLKRPLQIGFLFNGNSIKLLGNAFDSVA